MAAPATCDPGAFCEPFTDDPSDCSQILFGEPDVFNLTPAHFPEALEDFVDEVVPKLQQRGLFRSEYAGTTLLDESEDFPTKLIDEALRERDLAYNGLSAERRSRLLEYLGPWKPYAGGGEGAGGD